MDPIKKKTTNKPKNETSISECPVFLPTSKE